MEKILKDHRCKKCRKLFFKGDLKHCSIEVKCRNCKEMNLIKGKGCGMFVLCDDIRVHPDKKDHYLIKSGNTERVLNDKCTNCHYGGQCGRSK